MKIGILVTSNDERSGITLSLLSYSSSGVLGKREIVGIIGISSNACSGNKI